MRRLSLYQIWAMMSIFILIGAVTLGCVAFSISHWITAYCQDELHGIVDIGIVRACHRFNGTEVCDLVLFKYTTNPVWMQSFQLMTIGGNTCGMVLILLNALLICAPTLLNQHYGNAIAAGAGCVSLIVLMSITCGMAVRRQIIAPGNLARVSSVLGASVDDAGCQISRTELANGMFLNAGSGALFLICGFFIGASSAVVRIAEGPSKPDKGDNKVSLKIAAKLETAPKENGRKESVSAKKKADKDKNKKTVFAKKKIHAHIQEDMVEIL